MSDTPTHKSLSEQAGATLDRLLNERRGQIIADVTTHGIGVEAAWRVNPHVRVGGFAERQWGGRGFTAGGRFHAEW